MNAVEDLLHILAGDATDTDPFVRVLELAANYTLRSINIEELWCLTPNCLATLWSLSKEPET